MTVPDPAFSPAQQERTWDRLGETVFDVVVIGGGVTGTGVAWDAARRGLSVALFEASDLGAGTSGRSSRLVHGGLRYLETGDIRLVFEASGERRRLLHNAPHLVRPLPFLFPIYRPGPVGFQKLRAGLWAYDTLSLFRNIERHRMLRTAEVAKVEPGLARDELRGAGRFFDASVDDARLALTVGRAAHEAGARVLTHARVEAALSRDRVRVRRGDRTVEVSARTVVNATGPWLDRIRALFDPGITPRLRPTKGVHAMVERARLGQNNAIIFPSPVDERIMFVLPWGRFSYIGTTDTAYDGDPGTVRAEAEDVDYLLASANAIFPAADLTRETVISCWAGLRPLLAPQQTEGTAAGRMSREHEVWADPSGLVNVGGGKLTTFRVMACEAVDFVLANGLGDGSRDDPQCDTGTALLPGAYMDEPSETVQRAEAAARDAGLDPETATELAHAYGARVETIVELIHDDPALAAPVVDGLPYIRAQLVYGVRHEAATSLEDLLRRRLHLYYELDDGGIAIAPCVADLIGTLPELAWTETRRRDEVTRYREALRDRSCG